MVKYDIKQQKNTSYYIWRYNKDISMILNLENIVELHTGCPIIYDTITKCNNFTYLQNIIFIYVLNCSWIIKIYVKK